MPFVWIIEKNDTGFARTYTSIAGDFPTQLVASLESLEILIRIKKKCLPDVLIVDESVSDFSLQKCEAIIRKINNTTSTIYLVSNPKNYSNEDSNYCNNRLFIEKAVDGFHLTSLVNSLLSKKKPLDFSTKQVLSYKDLSLDFSNFEIKILNEVQGENIPIKEAKLLKLLLEAPGICQKRDDIKNKIWPNVSISTRTMDSHVSRLRKRLTQSLVMIESVYGHGYILK